VLLLDNNAANFDNINEPVETHLLERSTQGTLTEGTRKLSSTIDLLLRIVSLIKNQEGF
jgi:hypothetical protein